MKKILFLLLISLSLATVYGSNQTVSALSGSEFQAGRIMDDSIFFSTNNIGSGDIQNFLNSKVPVCDTNGSQPYAGTTRAAYGTSRGYPPPFICLKNYSQDTPTKLAESGLCNQYNGGVKSTAQIIFDVGISCGVNPRVLIVLLEKEQSLITDDWPWSIQYRSATGYGCPDTAPCDAEYYGFFNQVYNAARQFKRYQRDASLFSYRANRDNYIQYNPNSSCGGSNVYIQNQATAGLYNYTPYQPNPSVLANLYGSGDSCGAYGNRNFWRLFNDWFGTVNGGPYEWQIVSQEAFRNSSRTIPFTSIPTVQPNEELYLTVKIRNIGFQSWTNTNFKIGTSNPKDRSSLFQHSSWITTTRPAGLNESTIEPSQVGTFNLTLKAPTTTGTYREYYTPVIDGVTWLKDLGLYYRINVVSPITSTNPNYSLSSGEFLNLNQYILSPDRQSSLAVQGDGNLVLYSNFSKPAWDSKTQGIASKLVMQTDGNLVLYNVSDQPMWSTETYGNPGAKMVLKTDGSMVITSTSNTQLWSANVSHIPNHLSYVNTNLLPGIMFPGQSLNTANRSFSLEFQQDGNLVIYSISGTRWSTNTYGNPNSRLLMQNDGNLVIYNSIGQVLWSSRSFGKGPSTLTIQQDGNLVIYSLLNELPAWSSNTVGAP